MRIPTLLVPAAFAAVLLAGCSSTEATSPAASSSTSAPAGVTVVTEPQRVDPATFAAAVATPGVVTLDVRTPEEFAEGHIAGATNYNVEDPAFTALISALDPNTTYAVYCRSGNRSQVAVEQMVAAGITSIYEMTDGIIGWEAAGYPTQT
jgi:rhodanese-related sulfurtransferase